MVSWTGKDFRTSVSYCEILDANIELFSFSFLFFSSPPPFTLLVFLDWTPFMLQISHNG